MKEVLVKVEHAIKKYGSQTVLQDVSLEVEKGNMIGIVGRNGSGKTVLFKAICGFVPLDEGEIMVNGKVIGKDVDMAQNVGAIIENPGFLPNYSGKKNLQFLAKIQNRIGEKEIVQAIRQVGLDPDSKKGVGKYSLGMRQRLGFAQAIMENPDILILDEPMNGLDKHGVEEMRKLLLSLCEQGKTILIASHNPLDIDVLCSRVYEMDEGILTEVK
ncbi:MAG: ATP-binding cassette domain-containing protein [Lachnospiraceae bacterium]|nr:ATP-binding cassette domain-containing protein [Lachnospiraceae bacterium]